MSCSFEMKKWLSLLVFDPTWRLDEVLSDLQSMTPEERADLNQSLPEPFGFGDIEAELAMLIREHGTQVTAGRFVEFEAIPT
jgi:hypothetical protein